MGGKSNILTTTLSLLDVEYTNKYADKHYNEHPNKYNMFGISKMLHHYGVKNSGIRIENKEEDIHALGMPFIAHIGSDFVTVEDVSDKEVSYYWNKKKLTVPIKEFIDMWSGATLIVESDENSIEPDYKEHRKNELVVDIQKLLLLLAGAVLVGLGFYMSHIYQNIGLLLLLLFNLGGVYIGYLLVLKQMHVQSSQADKICSLFAQSDCNDVLNSPAAKFMGVIGWSELGFSYFLSNVFILLFAPNLLFYMVLINICALPYSFWSVWYQKFKAKTWCPLCLIVQVIFWALFIVSLVFGFIHLPQFTVVGILSIGLIYGIPFLIINLVLPYLAEGRKVERITQEFNSLKMNDQIFRALLKESAYHQADKTTSNVLLGNPEAKTLVTVFTNPHCEPCARMHNRIENLLKETDNLCFQYMLSSFSEELDSSCEFLLFVNQKFDVKQRDEIYSEWFKEGKYKKEDIFKKYGFEPGEISGEYKKHKEWKDETKLRATPTILVNGYTLPERYKVEDLMYFADLDVSSK